MKTIIGIISILSTSAIIACPQFSANNLTCTDDGFSFGVDRISLIGNTFTLSVFGQVETQTIPSSETVGDYTITVECSGNSVITTETFGPYRAVAVSTVQGNSVVSTGESMILECVNGDCENGPYAYAGQEPESLSCSW